VPQGFISAVKLPIDMHMPSAQTEPSGERRRPSGPERTRPALGATRHDQVDDAVLRERARTRAWLHDTVLQELEMLAAGAYADEPDPVAMTALAAGAADRLRRVIEGETPPAAGPLVDDIHAVVERERRRSGLQVHLRVGRLEPPWAAADAEPLSAALAEALRNVAKHAGATAVDVSCEIAAGVATVIVTDDGRGFDPARAAGGAGLRHSIIGRLEHEGGRVTVDSGPGRGTRLVLQLGFGLRLSRTAEVA
jgi:signal transduction histidine kinase